MSDVSAVTNYFATANEGFTTTLASTISSAATTVPLNSVSGLTNGTVFVGIIEPGQTKQQVFTGTVSTGSTSITGVKWTRGTNVGHSGGVSIVDYTTGTAFNMLTTGILKQHSQTGVHTAITATSLSTSAAASIGTTLGVTGAATHSSTTVLTGAVSGAGFSIGTIANPYNFSVYRVAAWTTGNGAGVICVFDTKDYDTGTNYSTSTGKFTAPITGYYRFNASVQYANPSAGTVIITSLCVNSVTVETRRLQEAVVGSTGNHTQSGTAKLLLTAGDYVCVTARSSGVAGGGAAGVTYFQGELISAT